MKQPVVKIKTRPLKLIFVLPQDEALGSKQTNETGSNTFPEGQDYQRCRNKLLCEKYKWYEIFACNYL